MVFPCFVTDMSSSVSFQRQEKLIIRSFDMAWTTIPAPNCYAASFSLRLLDYLRLVAFMQWLAVQDV